MRASGAFCSPTSPPMSPRTRSILSIVPWAAIVMAFGAGGGWAHASTRIARLETGLTEKVDRREAELRDSAIVAELRYLRTSADKTERRVRAMYCAGKPAGCE